MKKLVFVIMLYPMVLSTTTLQTSACRKLFKQFNVDFETKSKKGWIRVIQNKQLSKYGCDGPSQDQEKALLECIDSMPDDIGRLIGAKNE